jgi:hypothetical protein
LRLDGNTREAIEEFEQINAEYEAKLDAEADVQAELISRILKSVPKSWLVTDAPNEIDWSDPANFDYIQSHRYGDLLRIVSEGRHNLPSNEAKN